jgi:hypothetical protein
MKHCQQYGLPYLQQFMLLALLQLEEVEDGHLPL